MKVINFAETNSVLNQYVAEIRDVAVQGDRMRFRRNIERIGEIMAYEMSKELTYSVKQDQANRKALIPFRHTLTTVHVK